jgi:hypothetical protein
MNENIENKFETFLIHCKSLDKINELYLIETWRYVPHFPEKCIFCYQYIAVPEEELRFIPEGSFIGSFAEFIKDQRKEISITLERVEFKTILDAIEGYFMEFPDEKDAEDEDLIKKIRKIVYE